MLASYWVNIFWSVTCTNWSVCFVCRFPRRTLRQRERCPPWSYSTWSLLSGWVIETTSNASNFNVVNGTIKSAALGWGAARCEIKARLCACVREIIPAWGLSGSTQRLGGRRGLLLLLNHLCRQGWACAESWLPWSLRTGRSWRCSVMFSPRSLTVTSKCFQFNHSWLFWRHPNCFVSFFLAWWIFIFQFVLLK